MSWDDQNDNDPWQKPRKKNNPPDLDELIKRFYKKYAFLFGGKKGQGGAFFGSNKGKFMLPFVIVLLVFLSFWVVTGFFIVNPAERAVVTRFGKYVEILRAGLHWRAPIVYSRVIKDVEKVSDFSYTESMLTKDENIVMVSLAVQYRIDDLKNFLFSVVDPTESLKQATASSLRHVIGHTSLDDILTTGRETAKSDVFAQLNKIMEIYNAGLVVTDVVIQPARPPEEVKEAFDDAIKAQEDEQRFVNQADSYARGKVPIAKGMAKRIFKEAEAYKQQRILRAQGDVARFLLLLPEYQKAPSLTKERLYLDSMESVLSNSTKILLDVEGGNNLLYLPIDKLLAASSSNPKGQNLEKGAVGSGKVLNFNLKDKSNYDEISDPDSYYGTGGY